MNGNRTDSSSKNIAGKEFLLSPQNRQKLLCNFNRVMGKKNSVRCTTFVKHGEVKHKGQALTQALVTGFGVIIIILLIVVLNSNSVGYKQFVSASQMESTCLMIKSAVEDVQPRSDYVSATPTILGSVTIGMPEKIGSSAYRAGFTGNNITIQTLDEPIMKYSCSSGFPGKTGSFQPSLEFRGASNGGPTEILFVRGSGGDIVEMRKI